MSGNGTAPRRSIWAHVRAVAMAFAAAAAGCGLYAFQVTGDTTRGWWLLLVALVVGTAAQLGLRYSVPEPLPPPGPPSVRRRVIGLMMAVFGAALWAWATRRGYLSWIAGFDAAWLGWSGAVILLSIGLDLAWGTWPHGVRRRWTAGVLLVMIALLAIAAVYRLGNIADFPGEAAITQIEDLQVGNFGFAYLNGARLRWEFLSSTWLAALGIWLGGPSQLAMRVPFAVVSALKVVPVFVWLRLAVGTAGAVVGTALLAGSFWDVVLSRIPNNHNVLIVSIVFALLAGPARRGRPSAYVLLGFLSGYVLHEYVAYRPLAALAVLGATLYSLRDVSAGWLARLGRPLITIVLLGTMVMPLFLTRLRNTFAVEYLDGWNRAHAITGYYNPNDTWSEAVQRRIDRLRASGELFVVHGDRSPVRNVASQPPLVDPVTCALLVLGLAGAAAHLLGPITALMLLGTAITIAGTLVLTGNFDVARLGSAMAYVYVLAGYGAGGLWAAWSRAWGRIGRVLAALLLAAGVAGAGYWCTRFLLELWTSPTIRRAYRNNLAYLTIWLRDHARADERVLGVAPGYDNVFEGHDGSWLRGPNAKGFVAWDVETALRHWQQDPGPTLFLVYAGRATGAMVQFLETLLPELKFQTDVDPLDMLGDVAYARVPGPPPELAERLNEWRCRGVREQWSIIGSSSPEETLFSLDTVAPLIDKSTWPTAIPNHVNQLAPRVTAIRARYTATFNIATGGEYLFSLETYAGNGEIHIDGQRVDANAHTPIQLVPGLHRLEVTSNFAPLAFEPAIRLQWSGPDTGDHQEVMPFYRVATVDPSCAAGAGQAPFTALGAKGHRYLTDWLALGTFETAGENGSSRAFIDVPQLSVAPPPATAAGPHWVRIPPRESFLDLDGLFVPHNASGQQQWTCAYAATTIKSPAARAAYVELAGSGDPIEAWLNGTKLGSTPVEVGYDTLRHPVSLYAGSNLLVLKSCKQVGAWYFIARITDEDRHDVADISAAAALPSQPIPLAVPTPEPAVQLLDGFGAIVSAPHDSPLYADHRGGGPSSWVYVEDKPSELTFRTPPIPQRALTFLALTVSASPEFGTAQLFINDRKAVEFPIGGPATTGRWSANGYEVAFDSKGYFEGNSGVLLIGVPPEAITPGEPLVVRIALTGGPPRAWFMVKSYTDTVEHEGVSAHAALGLNHHGWTSAP